MESFIECLFDSDYQIGDNGSVKSLQRMKIGKYKTDLMKGATRQDGYRMYYLKNKWHYAHRLVAMHYCDNPNNYNEVNHIDGVKHNNHYTNLEWCTKSQNHRHRVDVLKQSFATGADHWCYGKPISDNVKQLMSQAKTGVNHPKFKGYYVFDGVKYTSITSLPRGWKISLKKVKGYCINGQFGYSFEPIDV